MRDVIKINPFCTTSGETVTMTSYADSVTYSATQPVISNITIDNQKTQYSRIVVSTPSSRKQDRIVRINERLSRLAK